MLLCIYCEHKGESTMSFGRGHCLSQRGHGGGTFVNTDRCNANYEVTCAGPYSLELPHGQYPLGTLPEWRRPTWYLKKNLHTQKRREAKTKICFGTHGAQE